MMTAAPPETHRVLVVDDEPNIADVISMALRFQGFTVESAADGRSALEAVATFKPDLLVLDVMLPDMEGFEVARRLSAQRTQVPIVFLTARDATEDKVRGLTMGGDDYVTKPFSLEELVARIRTILRRAGLTTQESSRLVFEDLELDDDTREVIRGQARDVEFERRDDVTLAECLAMETDKTGALLAVSASLGAILAGASQRVVDGFHTFGAELGLAFQIVDDLLGIWGSPDVTGKPVFADLAAGKKTLLVVWSIEHGGDAGADLAAWFATHGSRTAIEPAELKRAADLIEKAGGREWATAAADAHVAGALAALDDLDLDEAAHHTVIDLAHFVTERKL